MSADKGDTGNIWLNADGMLIVYPGPRKNYEAYLKDSEVYTLRSKILISASTASTPLDWDRYNLFIVDVSANTAFSIENARPDSDFVIVLRKDATGSTYNFTWPASLTWLITPIVTLTAASQEVVLQISYYNGTFRAGYFTGQVTALTAPGSAPTGGTVNQVLTKNSSTNYDYSWITPPVPTTFLAKASNLADVVSVSAARTNLGLGDAAQRTVGLAVGNLVEVVTGGKLPALDGTNLTGLPVPSALSTASGSAPSYSIRAWVNFNGTGTPSINASGNVSSITSNGAGDYTINFTTALPSANYAVMGMINSSSNIASAGSIAIHSTDPTSAPTLKTTTQLRIGVGYIAGSSFNTDYQNISVVVII